MELTWGTAEREKKGEIHGEKGVAALSLMDRCKERRTKNGRRDYRFSSLCSIP